MSVTTRWSDLLPRVLSGLAMSVTGAFVVWSGGWIFALTASLVCALIVWETARMFGADAAVKVGCIAGIAVLIAAFVPWLVVLPLLVAAALVCVQDVTRDKALFVVLSLWVMLGCLGVVLLREAAGLIWLLWLVLVVVTSDIAGYFAGRMIGGPKFWASISPKKTWSGTAAGWLGTALIGLVFAGPTGAGAMLIPVSILVGFSGQMGDIAQSAVKRRAGIKDSSNLIPGHGGVFDRFDAFMGAAVMALLLWVFHLLPGLS